MTNNTLNEQIYKFIEKGGHVTFPEIGREFGTGNILISTATLDNINAVMWVGLSQDVANTIRELHAAGRIEYIPCHPLTHVCTSESLNLPIMKHVPIKSFKTQHWLPTLITTCDGGQ